MRHKTEDEEAAFSFVAQNLEQDVPATMKKWLLQFMILNPIGRKITHRRMIRDSSLSVYSVQSVVQTSSPATELPIRHPLAPKRRSSSRMPNSIMVGRPSAAQ